MHKNNYRQTWKKFGKKIDPNAHWLDQWPSIKMGRYMKRKLSKARRRAWKNPDHERGLASLEGEVNWKGW